MNLRGMLDDFTTETLGRMLAAWGAGNGVTRKADRIDLLATLLTDPDTFRKARWKPAEAVLLALFARAEPPTIAQVFPTARMRGEGAMDEALVRLVTCGALLPTWEVYGRKLDLEEVLAVQRGRLALAPGLAALPPLPVPEPPPIELRRVPDEEVREIRPNLGGETAAGLVALVACAARVRLKVNKDGTLSISSRTTLSKELGIDAEGVSWLLSLALGSGLLVGRGDRLEPGASAVGLPLGALLARVLEAFILRGIWLDHFDIVAKLPRFVSLISPPSALDARPVVYGALTRLRNDGWVRLDDLVDALLAIDPLLGLRWDGHAGYRYRGAAERPSERQQQREFVRGAIVQTAWRLGVVDVGSTGEWYEPVETGADYQYDRQFRDGARHADPASATRPRWAPSPCALVVRIPPLGRRVLGVTRDEPPIAEVPGFHVGMDYEVVAPRATTPPGLLFALDRAGVAHPSAPSDPVRRWRLERARWLAALQGGLDGTSLLAALATAQGRPLPGNVTDTIAGWGEGYGTVSVWPDHDLVEFPDRAARDAAAPNGGTAIGDRFLLSGTNAHKARVIDYSGALARVLDVQRTGRVSLRPPTDLLVAGELAPLTSGEGDALRLDPAKLRGQPSEAVLRTLSARAHVPLTPGTRFAVRGWCGDVSAQLAVADLLQLADAADAAALVEHPEIAALVAGVLPGGLLVVKPGVRPELLAALAALGITPGSKLRFGGSPG